MKKLLKISIAAAMALVAGYSIYASQQKVELSDLTQRNIEALATNESSDCHYVNGYVAFTTKSGGAYDCCNVWVSKAPDTKEGHCR